MTPKRRIRFLKQRLYLAGSAGQSARADTGADADDLPVDLVGCAQSLHDLVRPLGDHPRRRSIDLHDDELVSTETHDETRCEESLRAASFCPNTTDESLLMVCRTMPKESGIRL